MSHSKVYNDASICWRLSDDHLPTDHYVLEYRKWVQTQLKKSVIGKSQSVHRKIKSCLFSIRLGSSSPSPSQEDGEERGAWRTTDRVYGSSTVVRDLESNGLYAFRVQCCRNSMLSPYSPEVTFHTPPAPGRPQSCDKMFPCMTPSNLSFWHFIYRLKSQQEVREETMLKDQKT